MAIEWIEEISRIRRILAEAETSSRLQAIRSLELLLNQEALNLLEEYHASAISFEKFFMEKAMKNIRSYLQSGEVPLEIERARERSKRLKETLERVNFLDSTSDAIGIEDVAIGLKKTNLIQEEESLEGMGKSRLEDFKDPGFEDDHPVVHSSSETEHYEEVDDDQTRLDSSGLEFGVPGTLSSDLAETYSEELPGLLDDGLDSDVNLENVVEDSNFMTTTPATGHEYDYGPGLEPNIDEDVSDYDDILQKPSEIKSDYDDLLGVEADPGDYTDLLQEASPHGDEYDDLLPSLATEEGDYDDLLPSVSSNQEDYDDLLPAGSFQSSDYDDLMPTGSDQADSYDDLLPALGAAQDMDDDFLSGTSGDFGEDDLLPPMESVQDEYEDLLPPMGVEDAYSPETAGNDYDDLLPPIQTAMAPESSMENNLSGTGQSSLEDDYDDLLPPMRQVAEDFPQNEGGPMDLDDLLPPIKTGD